MKRLILIFATTLVLFYACNNAANNTDSSNNNSVNATDSTTSQLAEMSFISDKHDFGTIKQGEKVAYTFKFVNTGNAPLVISSAKGSCGCTVPKYSDKPVAPGDEGTIDVEFDSAGKMGNQHKTVTITANIKENQKILTITGAIVEAK